MQKLNMKNSMAAALILTTVFFAVPAAAKNQVPFKGALQGSEIDTFQGPPPGTLFVNGSVTGIGSHVGKFSYTYKVTVNLATGGGPGFGQMTAANGDLIYTTIVGQGEPTDIPGINRIVEINTITGGTGRFEGATGSFTVERLVDLATGATSGSFHGTITVEKGE